MLQQGLYQQAIDCFTDILEEGHDRRFEVQLLRAIAYRKLKAYDRALQDHDSILNLMPNLAEAYCERGITRYHMGDGSGALEDMDQAVELEPHKPYRWSSRAYIRGHQKDVDGAIEDYRKALELDPDDAIVQNNLGILEDSKGYRDQAKARFKRADHLAEDAPHLSQKKAENHDEAREAATDSTTQDGQKPTNGRANLKQAHSAMPESGMQTRQRLGLTTYMSVIGKVFTSSQERREFFAYIRQQMGLF